jgi:pimeloyl-ACP methyl ester carboxylesterase
MLHYQEWGAGDPVIALHPLALESSAFAGVAGVLADQGLRTLGVDLPGFGRSLAPAGPLTPARLAEPVLELARRLERPPLLLGLSLGGRVALEAALAEPKAFRGAVIAAPYLPWRRWRPALGLIGRLDPRWGMRIPLERAWPLLKRIAEALERIPDLEHDWLARASVRVIYTSSCPATRASFLSAVREMALDPPNGPRSVWTRLPRLAVPATFLWAGRDALVPRDHARHLDEVLPRADQLEAPCSGHFVSGAHFRCMRHAISLAVARTLDAAPLGSARCKRRGARVLTPCLVGDPMTDEEGAVPEPIPAAARAAGARGVVA